MLRRLIILACFGLCVALQPGGDNALLAECWAPHGRPINSTEPRDSSVPEIPGGHALTVTILDDAGRPIPQARFGYFGDPKPHPKPDHWHYVETDDHGQFVIWLQPDTVQNLLQIEVDQPGFAPYNATWDSPKTDPIPDEFTIRLEKAGQVGGIVHDENGQPVAGADVEFRIHWKHRSRTPQICSYGVWVKTDDNGVWSCDLVPPDMLDTDVLFQVNVKGYMTFEQMQIPLSSFLPDENGNFLHVSQMDRGLTVRGRVTDEAGQPIADAVVFGNYMDTREDSLAKTDANGEYELLNWPESETAYIGVWSPGKMSVISDFTLSKDNVPTVDITMRNADKPLKIKIIDKEGKPVPGYMIAIERWGKHRLVNAILLEGKQGWASTGEDGYWVWNEAPDTEVVFDMMKMGDWMDIRDKGMTARDEEYVFTAALPLEVSGKITDAETGEALPTFKVYLGMGFEGSNDLYWDFKPNSGKDGTYLVGESFPRPRFAVKIEADGYEPGISRDIAPDEGVITIDFAMQKLSAEKLASVLKGTVLTPDGQPAARATIVLVTRAHNHQPMIYSGGNVRPEEPYVIQADADGKFQFGFFDFEREGEIPEYARQWVKEGELPEQFTLCILDATGFKKIGQKEWESQYVNKPITLEQWGEVQGTVKNGTRPASDVVLVYQPAGWDLTPSFYYQTKSDELGNFTFRRVPPGNGLVSREIMHPGANFSTLGDNTEVNVTPGETVTVTFGGEGRPVTGTLVLDKGLDANVDFKKVEIQCAPYYETPQHVQNVQMKLMNMIPKEITEETNDAKRSSLLTEWFASDAGKEYMKLQEELTDFYKVIGDSMKRSRAVAMQTDGTFRIENITEGEWRLGAYIPEVLATLSHRFTMEAIPGGVSDEPLDLGTLVLKKVEQRQPFLQVGQETPDFEMPQIVAIPDDTTDDDASQLAANGATLKLADYKGKTVILEFWATWCGPCLEKLPELKKFYQTIEGDPRFVMIGVSLDNEDAAEMVGRFVAKREIPWQNALAGNWDSSPMLRDYGISSIPAILLIGPDGKVVLSNPTVEELKRKVDEMK